MLHGASARGAVAGVEVGAQGERLRGDDERHQHRDEDGSDPGAVQGEDRDEHEQQPVGLHVPLDLPEQVRRSIGDTPEPLLERPHEDQVQLHETRPAHPFPEVADDAERNADEGEHHLVRPGIDDVPEMRLTLEQNPPPESERALILKAHLLKAEDHLLDQGELAIDEVSEPRRRTDADDEHHDPPGEPDEDREREQRAQHNRTHHAEDAEHVGCDPGQVHMHLLSAPELGARDRPEVARPQKMRSRIHIASVGSVYLS